MAVHQHLTRLMPHLPSLPLHGSMHQPERVEALRKFKAGGVRVLVATDVAARGLDVKGLRTVVVWEVGRDKDSHIHRVGRVGRAGQEGRAVTLLTEDSGLKGGGHRGGDDEGGRRGGAAGVAGAGGCRQGGG